MSRNEKNTAVIFCGMVLLWALADIMGTDLAAIAFGGLALLMICGIFDTRDLQQEGGTLEVFVWFAILYAMSTALNELGFMEWLGANISVAVGGLDWPLVYVALLPVFLEVGVGAGVPGSLMAFQYYLPPITLPQSRRRRARRMFSLPEAAIWKLRKFTVPACCSLWPIPLSLASSEPSGFFWSTADRSKGAAPQQNLAA